MFSLQVCWNRLEESSSSHCVLQVTQGICLCQPECVRAGVCLENSLIMDDQGPKAREAPLAELTGIQFGVLNAEDIVSFTWMQSSVFSAFVAVLIVRLVSLDSSSSLAVRGILVFLGSLSLYLIGQSFENHNPCSFIWRYYNASIRK